MFLNCLGIPVRQDVPGKQNFGTGRGETANYSQVVQTGPTRTWLQLPQQPRVPRIGSPLSKGEMGEGRRGTGRGLFHIRSDWKVPERSPERRRKVRGGGHSNPVPHLSQIPGDLIAEFSLCMPASLLPPSITLSLT